MLFHVFFYIFVRGIFFLGGKDVFYIFCLGKRIFIDFWKVNKTTGIIKWDPFWGYLCHYVIEWVNSPGKINMDTYRYPKSSHT